MRRKGLKSCLFALGSLTILTLAVPDASAVTGPHNMSGKTPGGQVCVACHAPHKVPSSPLLWNHFLSDLSYSWSDWTRTTGDTALPTNIKTWSGPTKLCLSCHDGTVEIGKIHVPATTFDSTKITGSALIAPSGDLKGTHPVAVPYPYNTTQNTYNGITTGSLVTVSEYVALPSHVRIYADPSAPAPNNKGIECSSCHDPHDDTLGDYLRDAIAGSAICLDCHRK